MRSARRCSTDKMKLKSYTTAPLLAALVYLLTLSVDRLPQALDVSPSAYLWIFGGIQTAAYLLPLLLYGLLFGGISVRRMRLAAPTAVSLPLLLLLAVILLLGAPLLSMLALRLGLAEPSVSVLSGVSAPRALILFVFAVIPAVCEEVIFRGVILPAFEPCGTVPAVIGTSLLFTFAHMSPGNFAVHFFASVVLCLAVYAGRSLFAPILLHTAYNVLTVCFSDKLSGIAAYLESFALLFILLFFALCIFILLALGEGARVYRLYAARGYDSSYTPAKLTRAQCLRGSVAVYFSVPFLLCTLIYVAVSILSMQVK